MLHHPVDVWVWTPAQPTPILPLLRVVSGQTWQTQQAKDLSRPVSEVVMVPQWPPYWLVMRRHSINRQRIVQRSRATVAQGSKDFQLSESTLAPTVPQDSGVLTRAKPDCRRHQSLRHSYLTRKTHTPLLFWPFMVLKHPPTSDVLSTPQHQEVPMSRHYGIKTRFLHHPDYTAKGYNQ